MPKSTPLLSQHQELKAKIVDFHGWQLPIDYGSALKEHQAVREHVGMFDVSHMTVLDLLGAGGRQFLRYLLANDVDRLSHMGKALYSCLLSPRGGIIDDLIVYMRAPDNYRLILNAATRERVLNWIRQQANGVVGLQERIDMAMIAVQGPDTFKVLEQVFDAAHFDAVSTLQRFEAVEVNSWFIARTGYTGEDGVEILLPKDQVANLWQQFIDAGVQPCGLAARDGLRLEAGMMLSGQDFDETTTPLESALSWTVAWEPEERDFIGRGSLEIQRERGVQRKLVGLVLDEKAIMRHGQKVSLDSPDQADIQNTGVITSGGFSPTLQKSIAFARIPNQDVEQVVVEMRGKKLQAKVVKPRFVQDGKAIV